MKKDFIQALKTTLPRSHCYQSRKNYMKGRKKCIQCNPDGAGDNFPNKIDCICNSSNILVRPAAFEETCFIFDMVENNYGVNSTTILSLKNLVIEVIFPDSTNYDFYRLNYNHRFNFYPVAIVLAHKVSDIVNTIKFCKMTSIPLRVRGGAHCYQPASLVNFGVILDQRPRDKIIKIDENACMIQIQAGALLGPFANKLGEKNLLIPTGTCVTNGLAGLTLGGGIGFALREYGLTLDQLVGAKVVLADGSVTIANADNNNDLFWALRGAGGGNFCAVTDFMFEYVPMPWVTIFTINFKFDDAKIVLKTWQDWAPYTDTKLTSEYDIHNKYQPVIVTGQLLAGSSKESDKKKLYNLIQPLIKLGIHTDLSIKTMSVTESYQYFGQGSYARPLFFYNQSDFNFKPLPDTAIDTIIYYMSLLDETQSYHKTEIDALGGNFGKIPFDATAFPSRDAICWIQYTSLWDTSNEEKHNVQWLKNYYHAMRPYFPLGRKYVNALDYDTDPHSALESYYGPNLPNLIKIKRKYDPTNFFNFEQSIPIDYEIDAN